MRTAPFLLLLLTGLVNQPLTGQERNILINTDWDHERHSWESSWIAHPTASPHDYGVFIFRNRFELEAVPQSQIIYVSGDNRYRLFVNGRQVCTGPARGSLPYWRYETIDISPFLVKGRNLLAAEVFNLGEYRPVAQFSHQTAFLLQAEGAAGKFLNTGRNTNWKVLQNKAYHVNPVTREMVRKFYVAGPCDSIYARDYPWNWENLSYQGDDGLDPRILSLAVGRGYMHGTPWSLVPRNLPMMEEKEQPVNRVIRIDGQRRDRVLGRAGEPMVIPGHSRRTLLLDNSVLTIGYPVIQTRKGTGSKIKVIYAEALYNPDGSKGNRNDINNKKIEGYYDVFLPDGGLNKFRPLWLRTFRFIQLEIETAGDELIIDAIDNLFTVYPLEQHSSFISSDPVHARIMEVGWRTARLCAGETYMDCPYWEQLQYIGDTRIQALVSLYNSGDDRLMRNALLLADQSRIPDGLTLGRAPSAIPQVTPPFSLYWIDMLHDYYMLRPDDGFIRQFLPGIESVLSWFEWRIDGNNLLGPLDWFNFTDWTPGFQVGVPTGADTGHSALITLNYIYAMQRASELFEASGDFYRGERFKLLSEKLTIAVRNTCFDSEKGLFSDTPEKKIFSQHTNIWAILTGTATPEMSKLLMEKILADTSLIQTTIYYKFYLFEALKISGLGDRYLSLLDPWKEMLAKGLTTFEEGDYEERSDCHGWAASPNFHFLSLVCGISPAEPGFKSVRIEPSMGNLVNIKAEMPHPKGTILMELVRGPGYGLSGSITLPEEVSGTFYWHDKSVQLNPGYQKISL